MKKIIAATIILSALALPAFAADAQGGKNQGRPANLNQQQDPYQLQMKGLMDEIRGAKTPEQRKEIQGRMDQARKAYRAAHPVKEVTPAEKEARKQKMEAELKKDPYRWQMYQLQQSMMGAKTPQERQTYQAQMKDLRTKHAAEQEAKLTPEQRAAAQARKQKNEQLQAELKPLNEKMRSSKTPEERKAVQAQRQEIYKKYR